jgi:hypothetical protein
MEMLTGCLMLALSNAVMCYAGDRVTCSDERALAQAMHISTCQETRERIAGLTEACKRAGGCSENGAISFAPPPDQSAASHSTPR